MSKKVSIIIPVYNTETYLSRCIESVLSQSYGDIELILVNDGSTDKSGQICDSYRSESRVKVLHKKNSGSSDSRNAGIDVATGDYLMFVDSDDYVSVKIIQELMSGLIESDADISVIGYRITVDNEPISEETVVVAKKSTLDRQQALNELLYQKNITNSPWAKLYKANLFKDIRYPSGKINQDLGTTYKVFAKADKVAVSDRKLYYYMQRAGSIINSPFSMKRMAGLDFAQEQLEFMTNNYPSIVPAAKNRLFTEAVSILLKIRSSINRNDFLECERRCRLVIKSERNAVLFDGRSRMQPRVTALISYLGFGVFVILGETFKKRALKRITN